MFPQCFYGENKLLQRSLHGGDSIVKTKNVSQQLKVSTEQVCKVFVECFNGDKNSPFNGEKKRCFERFFNIGKIRVLTVFEQ